MPDDQLPILLSRVRVEAMRADGTRARCLAITAWVRRHDPEHVGTMHPEAGGIVTYSPHGAKYAPGVPPLGCSVLSAGRWLIRIGDMWIVHTDRTIATFAPELATTVPPPEGSK